jgi:hypothetical protein
MSTALEHWDDLEFVCTHYPDVAQAHADGYEVMGSRFLIPDGRLMKPNLGEKRFVRQDVLPRTLKGSLDWAVKSESYIYPLPPRSIVAFSGRTRERAMAVALTGVDDLYAVV